MIEKYFDKLYIDGQWLDSESGQWIEVENPFTQEIIARVPRGSEADVDKAVQAARRAFQSWAAASLAERIALMEKFLTIFRSQEDALTELIVQELGVPAAFARSSQVQYQYVRIRSYIDTASMVPFVEKLPQSTVYRHPVGVVGCITPWNYPLGQVVQKVVPALLMGNTVVLKPSQQTPLSAYLLAEAFERAGFPAGVFNLVTGRGAEVGDAMASHPELDMISFTGSTTGGVKVAQNALASVKHISLELGGKSPCVLLPDASYEQAVKACFNTIFLNSGQTCTALSRLIVPRADQKAIEKMMQKLVMVYPVGNPHDAQVKVGPVASRAQFLKIKSCIEQGLAEGAELLVGTVPEEGHGYFIKPTIITQVENTMAIARQEIFGPVLCVLAYDTLEEALAIANDTSYGLNAAVWGEKQTAIAFARKLECGNVYINDGPRDTAAPFGGWKQSGLGREGGLYGLLEFTQQQALFDCGH